jgi:16S rRNA (guanine966-N2)-methyltransferase
VRESLFNILQHGIADFSIEGVRVLDLFAGTGALGIEAISRGAASCLFVEEDAEARGLVRTNMETFALTGITKLFRRDATSLGPAGNLGTFGLVMADPPYGKGLGEAALASAIAGGWLAPGAIVVLEERGDAAVSLPQPLVPLDRRVYGDTQVLIARFPATP